MNVRLPALALWGLLPACYIPTPFSCPPDAGIEHVVHVIVDGTYASEPAPGEPDRGTLEIAGDLVVHTYIDEEGREVQVAWEVTGSSLDD